MPARQKKIIFIVQGEGRGHMTQAIGLYQLLSKKGHTIPRIFIGKSQRRKIPQYFYESFGDSVNIELLESPNFVADAENKSIRLIPSIIYNAGFLSRYKRSMDRIHSVIKDESPDVLINFYDFLGGFYHFFYRPDLAYFVIGHQFLAAHPEFKFAKGHPVDKRLFRFNNYLTSMNSDKKLALSFRPYQPSALHKTVVMPPVLRNEIHQYASSKENFLLGYMVNDGYSMEIIDWHKKNRDEIIHCFWDKKGEPEVKEIHENLVFHQLNAGKFMDMMARCKGILTTAGFESVCEAMYFGKPVLMVPVAGQYEQACNAIDAASAGAGIYDVHFNISRFLNYLPTYEDVSSRFRHWLSKLPEMLEKEMAGV